MKLYLNTIAFVLSAGLGVANADQAGVPVVPKGQVPTADKGKPVTPPVANQVPAKVENQAPAPAAPKNPLCTDYEAKRAVGGNAESQDPWLDNKDIAIVKNGFERKKQKIASLAVYGRVCYLARECKLDQDKQRISNCYSYLLGAIATYQAEIKSDDPNRETILAGLDKAQQNFRGENNKVEPLKKPEPPVAAATAAAPVVQTQVPTVVKETRPEEID